jgi:hypothetical protein
MILWNLLYPTPTAPTRAGCPPQVLGNSQAGANPTTASYNASVVNFYNATDSLARFENKIVFFYFQKRTSLPQRWRCSCKLRSRRIGSSARLG